MHTARKMLSALALAAGLGIVTTANAEAVYGVTQGGFLVSWDSATPGTINSGVAIQGLASNEALVGIDLRPATGEVFGLGSFSRIYRLDVNTGMATAVAGNFAPGLNGGSFGMDFNPTVDRIRLVSDADQNLRANPNTGQIAVTDPSLAYAAGDINFGANANVVHAAYTNNFNGATSTTLYGLDAGTDSLVRHTVGPGFAQLVTVGGVGTDITEIGGFDISGTSAVAYAAIRDVNLSRTTFWTINLMSGQGMMVGEVGGGHIITAMTVVPEPATLSLLALAGLMGIRRR